MSTTTLTFESFRADVAAGKSHRFTHRNEILPLVEEGRKITGSTPTKDGFMNRKDLMIELESLVTGTPAATQAAPGFKGFAFQVKPPAAGPTNSAALVTDGLMNIADLEAATNRAKASKPEVKTHAMGQPIRGAHAPIGGAPVPASVIPAKPAPVSSAPGPSARPVAAMKTANFITAEQFTKQPVSMKVEEFNKLSFQDRNRCIREGVKVVD